MVQLDSTRFLHSPPVTGPTVQAGLLLQFCAAALHPSGGVLPHVAQCRCAPALGRSSGMVVPNSASARRKTRPTCNGIWFASTGVCGLSRSVFARVCCTCSNLRHLPPVPYSQAAFHPCVARDVSATHDSADRRGPAKHDRSIPRNLLE